jgi:hypothetical protein
VKIVIERLGYTPALGLHIMNASELQSKADNYFQRALSFTNRENAAERLRLAKKGAHYAALAKKAREEEHNA